MKRVCRILAATVASALIFCGCQSAAPLASPQQAPSPQPSAPAESSPAPTESSSGTEFAGTGYVKDGSIIGEWETKGAFTPPKAVTTEVSSYKICEGTEMENEVIVLTAKELGPAIYIVASVHGDEIAGYTAADKLKAMELKKGTLYILSPANKPGAARGERYVFDKEDLNRSFPGKADGTRAEQLAAAIYGDIEKVKPALLLDLHEARLQAENRDFLGSSLIYTTLDGIDELFLNMHQATQDGELCSEPFNFFGPGPIGSINNTVATNLKIPAITVETYRAYELERRVDDQLAVLGYVLNYYGME